MTSKRDQLAAIGLLFLGRAEHAEALARIDRALAAMIGLFLDGLDTPENLVGLVPEPPSEEPEVPTSEPIKAVTRRKFFGAAGSRKPYAKPILPEWVGRGEGGAIATPLAVLASLTGSTRPGDLLALFKPTNALAMRRIVDRLVDAGLVERLGLTNSTRIQITEAGRARLLKRDGEPLPKASLTPQEPRSATNAALARPPIPPGTCIGPDDLGQRPCPTKAAVDGTTTRRCTPCILERRRTRIATEHQQTLTTTFDGRKGQSLLAEDGYGSSTLANRG